MRTCMIATMLIAAAGAMSAQNPKTVAGGVPNRVADRQPNNSVADSLYQASLRTEDIKERQRLLQEALGLEPRHPRAHLDFAVVLLRQNQIKAAQTEFATHMRVSPYGGRSDGFRDMAFAREMEGRGLRTEAIDAYRQIMNAAASESAFERCYLFLNFDPGRYADMPTFQAALQRLRPYCTATEHRDAAVAMLNRGLKVQAIQQLESQVQANPLYQETYFLLADLYRSQHDDVKLTNAIRNYFTAELDVAEKCRMYAQIRLEAYEKYDNTLVSSIRSGCKTADAQH